MIYYHHSKHLQLWCSVALLLIIFSRLVHLSLNYLCLAGEVFPDGGTPLHYAAFCGLHDFVKILTIECPQDVDSQSFSDEATPLHLAPEEGHVDVARILVEQGTDITASLCTRTPPPGRAILRFWRPGTTLMSTYRPLRR